MNFNSWSLVRLYRLLNSFWFLGTGSNQVRNISLTDLTQNSWAGTLLLELALLLLDIGSSILLLVLAEYTLPAVRPQAVRTLLTWLSFQIIVAVVNLGFIITAFLCKFHFLWKFLFLCFMFCFPRSACFLICNCW